MYSVWTDHLKTPEDKERFRSSLESAKPVLDRLQAILDDKATAIDTAERSVANYDNPNWAYRQAHPNEDYLEVLLGPGGKYDASKYESKEEALKALARGKYEGDLHIDNMKRSQHILREDYTKRREQSVTGPNLKEVLDQYMADLKQSQSNNQTHVQEDKSVFDETKVQE